jgi:hypothetical protein
VSVQILLVAVEESVGASVRERKIEMVDLVAGGRVRGHFFLAAVE